MSKTIEHECSRVNIQNAYQKIDVISNLFFLTLYWVPFYHFVLVQVVSNLFALVQAHSMLLLIAGDVEVNPGPVGKLNINSMYMYFLTICF